MWRLRISLGPDPVKVRPDGRPYYRQRSTTFKGTKTEARAERARLQAQWYPETERTDTTFGELFLVWLGSAELAGTTRQAHQMTATKHILPAIGRTKLRHLSTLDIEALYGHLLRPKSEGGAGLAPSSIRRIHSVIDSALKRAVAWEWLDRNPAEFAKPPRIHGRPTTITPTKAEMRRAIAAARTIVAEGGDKAAYALVWTAAGTGMRRGELCGLKWEDVDWVNQAIHVRRNIVDVGGHVEVKLPKNGEGRQVEVSAKLVTVLREYQKTAGKRSPWVWSTQTGERVRPDKLSDLWATVRTRAGLNEATRLHDVRHFYATHSMMAGGEGSLVGIAGNLGHADSSTTTKHYVTSQVEGRRMVADRIGADLDDKGTASE